MFNARRTALRWTATATLAATLLLSAQALAGPGDVNSTNDGANVAGGTYFNTAGDKTTFINSAGTGLTVGAGTTVSGKEVDGLGNLTGNGGWLDFRAPGQVVRIDGNVDVSGVLNGNGAYTGNGGRVTIESGFLYQNGNIYANGLNGGMVQTSVGSMSVGDNAHIEARGTAGAGGQINLDGTTSVNVGKGAILDTSGAVIGSYNTNVINIRGGLVNIDGIVQANGLNPGQNGGNVNVVATTGSVTVGSTGRISADGASGANGSNPVSGGNGGLVQVFANSGKVTNNGILSANGGDGGQVSTPEIGPTSPAVDANGNIVYAVDTNGNPILDANGNRVPLMQQASLGKDGGNGGNAGDIKIRYGTEVVNNGQFQVIGGNGGNGQEAIADAVITGPNIHTASAGDGGNGGDGGYVEMIGGIGAKVPSAVSLSNINVDGGAGGLGGKATVGASNPNSLLSSATNGTNGTGTNNYHHKDDDCGCDHPPPPPPPPPPSCHVCESKSGKPGQPGHIYYAVDRKPPKPPEFPPYPKEYPRLGEALPPGIGPVVSYNRSIFLARAPLPVVKKRPKPVVLAKAPTPPKPAPKKPPQRKATVRGYW